MTRQQLALGTAQFGLDYGITNTAGRVPPAQVAALLRTAWQGGVRMIDTAHAYGDSEQVLGECMQDEWRLVTKTLPLRCERIGDHELRAVDAAFQDSLRRLGVARVDTLLVHHAQDLLAPGGEELHTWLLERKSEGTALRVGASVYDGDEVAALLDRFDIDVVQLPANIADQRLLADGSIPQLHGSDVEVHVRS
ncbi:MAG TPA: aldo/keto reductase, partial [Ramlibacter sp.]